MDVSLAECKKYDPELFFSDENDVYRHEQEARAICRICPIAVECLNYALKNDEIGIWGATDEKDRRNIRLGRPLVRRKNYYSPEHYQAKKRAKIANDKRVANLIMSNYKRTGLTAEASGRIIKALIDGGDSIPAETRLLAELRVNNPKKSLTEIAELSKLGLTKDQVAGRLSRLVKGVK